MIQGKSESEKMIVLRSPRSAISEAYRVLRTNLEYAAVANNDMRRLLVTSAGAGEGKSTTAANLAASLAQAGKRVVLVDADLRRPTQHQIFSISNSQGLTTALLNTTGRPIEEFLQPTSLDTLRVLPSGPMPPNPAEILGSAAMSQILDDLSRVADIVIFDSPPVLGVADSAIMAPMVDGVLLVLHWGATRRDGLMRAKEVLAPVGTPILGLVLNRMTNDSRGYYYYTYYRSHYYTGENPKRAHRLAGLLQVIRR
jgi:capsular exopolysaccharide synthesis family protein